MLKDVWRTKTRHFSNFKGLTGGEKKKPDSIIAYNETKYGVDIVDQMAKINSVKAGSRRWPVHTFYNLLDLCGINA